MKDISQKKDKELNKEDYILNWYLALNDSKTKHYLQNDLGVTSLLHLAEEDIEKVKTRINEIRTEKQRRLPLERKREQNYYKIELLVFAIICFIIYALAFIYGVSKVGLNLVSILLPMGFLLPALMIAIRNKIFSDFIRD
ncbi:hypothetical protein [Neobacillus sp. YIM B06451]|uniref:hypothetical protein n=1 Tax=Neobacillus sp. YIM B06451 TaxID=3070994 RepID=UPI00292CB6D2|nr:hypothetical protein [Neobacillus sp. YIM B06451]